jgi:hypothetical protein
MAEPIAIVAIITAIGAAGALLFKHVKKSDCLGVHIETRTPPDSPHIELTPPPQPPPPSPINAHKNDKNNNLDNIKEIEV